MGPTHCATGGGGSVRTQPANLVTATARAQAVAKVARMAETWRQMYAVETVGVALHRAVKENA